MLMMLHIAHTLPLILERSGRRTELQIPTMLALLFTLRNLWHSRDGYPERSSANRNSRNEGFGRGVDERDRVGALIRHVGAGSIRRDRYPSRTSTTRNGRTHGVGRGVDDRDGAGVEICHIGAGSVRRDGYPNRIYAN